MDAQPEIAQVCFVDRHPTKVDDFVPPFPQETLLTVRESPLDLFDVPARIETSHGSMIHCLHRSRCTPGYVQTAVGDLAEVDQFEVILGVNEGQRTQPK